MPIAITATADTVAVLGRISITGATSPVTVSASPTGLDDYELRGPFAVAGSAVSAVDPELPFGRATVYTVTDATGAQASSAPITLTHAVCVLSDATDPSIFTDVAVVSFLPGEWEARSRWWDVLGRTAPFVTYSPMSNRSGDLVLRTESQAERFALLSLFTSGVPVILRSPTARIDDATLILERFSDELVIEGHHDGPHLLRARVKQVSRNIGPVNGDPARTWQTVKDSHLTWAAVLSAYPTWADVLNGTSSAVLSAEKLTDGDFGSGLTDWSTFWTAATVTWSGAGNTGRATGITGAAGVVGNLRDTAMQAAAGTDTITPGTVVRVTGRVRVSGACVARVTMLTNNATGAAEFFAAGVASSSTVVTPSSGGFESFVCEFTVPVGHTRYSVQFRAESMDPGDVVEFDDLSVRWRL